MVSIVLDALSLIPTDEKPFIFPPDILSPDISPSLKSLFRDDNFSNSSVSLFSVHFNFSDIL